jgi:hypothetical protein
MNLILNETKWVIVVIHPNRSKARDEMQLIGQRFILRIQVRILVSWSLFNKRQYTYSPVKCQP